MEERGMTIRIGIATVFKSIRSEAIASSSLTRRVTKECPTGNKAELRCAREVGHARGLEFDCRFQATLFSIRENVVSRFRFVDSKSPVDKRI